VQRPRTGDFVKHIYLTSLFVSILITRELNRFILIYLNIYLHARTPVRVHIPCSFNGPLNTTERAAKLRESFVCSRNERLEAGDPTTCTVRVRPHRTDRVVVCHWPPDIRGAHAEVCRPGECVLAGRSYHSFGQTPGCRSGTVENHHEKTKQSPQEKILVIVI